MMKKYYFGGFQRSTFHQFGILVFANGSYYVGHFKEGKFHGFGVYVWPNGETYEGYWWDGLKHGLGRFYPNGFVNVRFGIWEEGKRYVHFYGLQPDGKIDMSEVQMRNGELVGDEIVYIDYREDFKKAESKQKTFCHESFNRGPCFN